MKIGIIIGRFGDVDGVSLETQKWIDVLQKMGHEIFLLTGRLVPNARNAGLDCRVLPPLSFFSPECEWEQKRAFYYPDDSPEMLLDHLNRTSIYIAMNIFKWILDKDLELLISENASALPSHLSMGIALQKVAHQTGIPMITHDHDFYWERGDRYKTPFKEVQKIIEDTFPHQFSHIKHAVINTYSKERLKERMGIDSIVVPNVMDFSEPYGKLDKYNRCLPQAFNLKKGDIILGQVTRIVRRKKIETAIELVERLDDKRIKLIITGSKADDERFGYYRELVELTRKKKLKKQVFFGEHRIKHYREPGPKKIYSLSDAYANSVATTYFSSYEGFGNAFIESVLAKKPVFVNNYKPIYWPDIGSKGFRTVMTEDNVLTDEHVREIKEIITKPKLAKEIAEHNFKLGKKLFSYEVLEELLDDLIKSV